MPKTSLFYDESSARCSREWAIFHGDIVPEVGEIEIGTKFHTFVKRLEMLPEFELWRDEHRHEQQMEEDQHRTETLAQVHSFKERIGGENATLYMK